MNSQETHEHHQTHDVHDSPTTYADYVRTIENNYCQHLVRKQELLIRSDESRPEVRWLGTRRNSSTNSQGMFNSNICSDTSPANEDKTWKARKTEKVHKTPEYQPFTTGLVPTVVIFLPGTFEDLSTNFKSIDKFVNPSETNYMNSTKAAVEHAP